MKLWRKQLAATLFCVTILASEGMQAFACSLWAVTGDRSRDGGSLVGQTWDVPYGIKGELRLVIPEKGFSYLGLVPLNAKTGQHAVAGVNQHGLVLITATADSARKKKSLKGRGDLAEAMLASCATVDAALSKRDILQKSRPVFLLLADYSKIALVQIAPGGRLAVEVAENGLLFQTNHYTHQTLLQENGRSIENSMLRLNRLRHLLVGHPSPFTIDDFISIADDRDNGPDNSIWRTGGSPQLKRTLARLVVFLPKNAPPEIYFKLMNPGSNELNYEIKLDTPFWTEGVE